MQNIAIREIFITFAPEKMATLHIFNPEHDIALAANLSNFTAPHAGRQLRHDLGFLPAIWATDGYVLVENVEDAQRDFARVMHRQFERFVEKRQLAKLDITHVEPWGWDLALRSFLMRYGVEAVLSEEEIAEIRDLSHRKHAVDLLRELEFEGTTGKSWRAETTAEVKQALRNHRRIVVKAPWSSSGRGIRFIDNELNEYQDRWIRNVSAAQGSVVIETYCHKVKDFGMEFESDGQGQVRYLGLSLFHTENGAYKGNILAKESLKNEMLSRYISKDLLESVQQKICALTPSIFKHQYVGPFGVDMMVCTSSNDDGQTTGERHFLLHPCVEINLRRTMGHVALSLTPQDDEIKGVMRIDYDDNAYKLLIKRL